jgi:hypothetical protein
MQLLPENVTKRELEHCAAAAIGYVAERRRLATVMRAMLDTG